MSMISIFIVLFGVVASFFIISGITGIYIIYLIMAMALTPIITYVVTASYPEILAKRIRVMSIGRAPESINYLSMSMRLNPSLDQAIIFTGENADEPLGSGYRKIMWDLMMRKYATVEEAFVDFGTKWGEWNEDLRRALYTIRSATLERTQEGIKRTLDKANDIILTGTKSTIEKFAASLSGPTMILFSLGVVLPLTMGAMLPLASLKLPTSISALDSTAGRVGEEVVKSTNVVPIILMMNVIFPFIALVYSYSILGKRPGTTTPPDIKSPLTIQQKRTYLTISIVGGAIICSLGVPAVYSFLNFHFLLTLPLILGITFMLSFYSISTSRYQKKKRDEIIKMEEEFPNALFILGSRIAEGYPVETAIEKVSETSEGTLIANLFDDISYNLNMTRAQLEQVLFHSETGILTNLPSRTIRASMKTVIEAVKKDPITAGETIVGISTYLRDMKKVDHDIKITLSSVVDMMRSTAIFFSPIIMGITIALYLMLHNQFQALPFPSTMIPPETFMLIMGFYMLAMVIIIVYFSVGLEHGMDKVEMKYSIGTGVPVAILL
jgi:Flp pilus assembly protein TadB